jgi:uncharacterized membrane protein
MRALGLAVAVRGWMIAVGGLLASESVGMRLALALIGFGTAAAGVLTTNAGHLQNAFWKERKS